VIMLLRDPQGAAKMTPNEWGDFSAGCSAPLAFLWLVLGYLQQGQELKLNTKTLELQVEELKESVRQQRELVEVTRQQLESDREALQLEKASRKDALRPHFIFQMVGGSFAENRASYDLSLSNAGGGVTNVVASILLNGAERKFLESPMVFRTSEVRATIDLEHPIPDEGGKIRVQYVDGEGLAGEAQFLVQRTDPSGSSGLRFHQVAG
jgi:hypothetical protein